MSAEDYSTSRRFAMLDRSMGFDPLTEKQFDTLLAAGLFRTDVEIEAFDDMEKGHLARVRYLAGEVERLDADEAEYRRGYNAAMRDEGVIL